MLRICKLIIQLVLPALFIHQMAEAQLRPSTKMMERMLADAGNKGLQIEPNERQDLGILCKGKQIRKEIKNGMLNDMGIILFKEENNRDMSSVYKFIERYMLALLLKPGRNEQLYLLREDMVTLKVNGSRFNDIKNTFTSILQNISIGSMFYLHEDSLSYNAIWGIKPQQIELSFPKQYDLILGKDKSELVEYIHKEIALHKYNKTKNTVKIQTPSLPYLITEQVYAIIGDTFIIPQMQSGKYMYKKGDEYEYIFNERMGMESLLNLFSNGDEMNIERLISLTVKGYNFTGELQLSTAQLCDYMKQKQCSSYIGIETQTEKEYTGTVVYLNKKLMCMHLLYFKFPKDAFKKGNINIESVLHPYIPVNNISNLYEDLHKNNLIN